MNKTVIGLTGIVLALCSARAQTAPQIAASCTSPQTLNGSWRSNDGGTFTLRQIGTQVWWTGQSGDQGRRWTTVFKGTRVGNTVSGTWADLPLGQRSGHGALTVHLIGGQYGAASFRRVRATGNFSSTDWLYECRDMLPPVPQR